MKSGQKAHGYTIVEVMIFLIISGSLLTTGLYFFNGRQSRIRFSQSVIETEARIRTIISEVSSGYYPNKGDFSCTAGVGVTSTPTLTKVTTKSQGTNEGCIFLGKVLRFVADSSSDYKVYTVIGNQRNGNPPQEVTALQGSSGPPIVPGANPVPIFDPLDSNAPDNTENFTMPGGLRVTKIKLTEYTPAASFDLGSIAFILNFGSYSAGSVEQGLISGSQNIDTLPVGLKNANDEEVLSSIKSMNDGARNLGEIVICMQSNQSDRKAAIVIGGKGRGLSTESRFDNNTPTVCN